MHAGIWKAIEAAEDEFTRPEIMRSFKTVKQLRTIPQILKWVLESGTEATYERACLNRYAPLASGTCVTDYIIRWHLKEIRDLDHIKIILDDRGMLNHPIVGIDQFKSNVEYWLDVTEGGKVLDPNECGVAARLTRAIQIFDPEFFIEGLREGARFKEGLQGIFDCTMHREEMIRVFSKYGLDIYKLVGEPHPIL